MSLGVFEKYDDAQRAVDFLSDQQFPVQNCMIVGTELKQIERVHRAADLGQGGRGRSRLRRCGSACSSASC